jgi:uncharacterized protein (TIGR02466 family)
MIKNMFPTPVYFYKPKFEEVFLVQDEIKKTLPEIEKDTFERPQGWLCDIQTNINSRKNTIADFKMTKLHEYIKKHTYQYCAEVEPFIGKSIFMAHSWVNKSDKDQGQEWHSHSDSFISGVYYYQTTGEEGRLGIKNPVPQAKQGLFPAGQIVHEYEWFDVQTGMLILFPGWLEHQVELNTTNNTRITIAFNWLSDNEEEKRNAL